MIIFEEKKSADDQEPWKIPTMLVDWKYYIKTFFKQLLKEDQKMVF